MVRTINPAIQIIPAIEIPDILIITITMTGADRITGESVVTEMITAGIGKEEEKEEKEGSIIIIIILMPRGPMEGEQMKMEIQETQETQDNFGECTFQSKSCC
jgi:hypothetical protein